MNHILVAIGVVLVLILIVFVLVKIFMSKSSSDKTKSGSANAVLPSLGVSLLSSTMVTVYTVSLYLFLGRLMGLLYDNTMIVVLLAAVVSFGVYVILLLFPSIFMGRKYGLIWGVAVFGLSIMWIAIYLGIAIVVMLFVRTPIGIMPIMPFSVGSEAGRVETGLVDF